MIEHVYAPMAYLKRAAQLIKSTNKGLILSSVPNWYSMSTAIQCAFNSRIVRHIDPMIHVQMFTLNSILTAYILNGISPIAGWFYGMDAYEVVTQLVRDSTSTNIKPKLLSDAIQQLQKTIDIACISDEIALTGKVM